MKRVAEKIALLAAAFTCVVVLTATTANAGGYRSDTRDIVDVAAGAGSFNTLIAAVQAAGLEETLRGEGPFTVFAPTDEAFAAIPEADLKALLADREKLRAVLTYHVVPGRMMAGDVIGSRELGTAQGQALSVMAGDDGVMIDAARVVQTDIVASNGVIHVIDKVVLPN